MSDLETTSAGLSDKRIGTKGEGNPQSSSVASQGDVWPKTSLDFQFQLSTHVILSIRWGIVIVPTQLSFPSTQVIVKLLQLCLAILPLPVLIQIKQSKAK